MGEKILIKIKTRDKKKFTKQFHRGQFSVGQFSGGQFSVGQFSGWQYSGGHFSQNTFSGYPSLLHNRTLGAKRSRRSRTEMFLKIGVLKKFRNVHRETPVLESLVNIAKFLRAAFLQKSSGECFYQENVSFMFR